MAKLDKAVVWDALVELNRCENMYECVTCDCYYPKALYTDNRCPKCINEGIEAYSPCEYPAKGLHGGHCQHV